MFVSNARDIYANDNKLGSGEHSGSNQRPYSS